MLIIDLFDDVTGNHFRFQPSKLVSTRNAVLDRWIVIVTCLLGFVLPVIISY